MLQLVMRTLSIPLIHTGLCSLLAMMALFWQVLGHRDCNLFRHQFRNLLRDILPLLLALERLVIVLLVTG